MAVGVAFIGVGNISGIYLHNRKAFKSLEIAKRAGLRPAAAEARVCHAAFSFSVPNRPPDAVPEEALGTEAPLPRFAPAEDTQQRRARPGTPAHQGAQCPLQFLLFSQQCAGGLRLGRRGRFRSRRRGRRRELSRQGGRPGRIEPVQHPFHPLCIHVVHFFHLTTAYSRVPCPVPLAM